MPAILAAPKTKRAGPIGTAAEAVVAPDERWGLSSSWPMRP